MPDPSVPRFADSRFVGTEFATEAATRYFRALTGAEINYRCVRAHLNRSRFGCMDFPLKKIINNLTISLPDCIEYNYGTMYLAKTALADSLDSLLMLKENRDVKIVIYLPEMMQYHKMLFEFLEVCRPFHSLFRDAKMDVKILGYDFFNPIEDDSDDMFSEQLNQYFDRTPDEWLDMKAKEIKEIPDEKQRRACKGVGNPWPCRKPS